MEDEKLKVIKFLIAHGINKLVAYEYILAGTRDCYVDTKLEKQITNLLAEYLGVK